MWRVEGGRWSPRAHTMDCPATSPRRIKCPLCAFVANNDAALEGHVSADHLDYFPYGCAHCGHWMPTEQIAHQHVNLRKHFPIKIKENLDYVREEHLREILAKAQTENLSWSKDAHSKKSCEKSLEELRGLSTLRGDEGDTSSVSSSIAPDLDQRIENFPHRNSKRCDFNRSSSERIADKRRREEEDFIAYDSSSPTVDDNPHEGTSAQSVGVNESSSVPLPVPITSFEDDASPSYMPTANKKVNKQMRCLICQVDVIDSLVASHIYMVHINDKETVKCGYCPYGTLYAKSDVLRHIRAIHPNLPLKVIDRRKTDLQPVYLSWRSICFPEVGKNLNRAKSFLSAICGTSMEQSRDALLLASAADCLFNEEASSSRSRSVASPTSPNLSRTIKCCRCPKSFEKEKLGKHLWEDHLQESWPYSCLGCSKAFINIRDAVSHCKDQHQPSCDFEHNAEAAEQFESLMDECLHERDYKEEISQFTIS